jgi:hypothetical protein
MADGGVVDFYLRSWGFPDLIEVFRGKLSLFLFLNPQQNIKIGMFHFTKPNLSFAINLSFSKYIFTFLLSLVL